MHEEEDKFGGGGGVGALFLQGKKFYQGQHRPSLELAKETIGVQQRNIVSNYERMIKKVGDRREGKRGTLWQSKKAESK